jgi:hypothetical protein
MAAALALVPAIALAQEAPPASNAPTDAVGPKELQNFTLNGTVTRPADQPVAVPPTSTRRQPRAQAQSAPPPAASPPTIAPAAQTSAAAAPAPRRTETASAEPSPLPPKTAPAPEPLRQSPPSSSVTVALPKLYSDNVTSSAAASTPAAAPGFAPDPQPAGTLAPAHGFSLLPWLLAALALGAGGAFLFWRNRGREAFAGGPQVDSFTAPPVPAPAPRRAPSPPQQPAPKPASPALAGVVSTRLRPWIDIGFHPLRCILEDQRVVVQFEIELFNSGSAPARGVLVEATLFNAGQDTQIGNFFANPVGTGERIAAIPPLKRIAIRTQVAVPREQVQAYELGGRQVFVPVIAFNTLYSGSGGEGQTSVSYLLGRDTKGEKMGPFGLDLGPHIFRSVAARLLPIGVRQ